jgi:glycosyltransferase involved in cell wall biosynthesis
MDARTVAFLTPRYLDGTSPPDDGATRLALNLARGAAAASNGVLRVELIAFGPEASSSTPSPGVTLRILPATRRPSHPRDALSWDLPAAIAEADLVHVQAASTRSGEVATLVARQQRKPLCLSDHGGGSSDLGSSLGMAELADLIVCGSDFAAARFRTAVPVVVIKGGIDTDAFAPPDDPPRRDRVLWLGGHHPHEDGPIARLAEGQPIEPITDADVGPSRDLYARCRAVVLPAIDGQARQLAAEAAVPILLEAMSCEAPVIAPRIGPIPEFVRDGEDGFLFDRPEELVGALERLADDPALVGRMGAAGRAEVVRAYGLPVVGARLAAHYEELITRAAEAAA